jgi:hypothetical protein
VDPEARVALQIGTDPTVWVIVASQEAVTGAASPTAWPVVDPIEGQLVLSPQCAGSLVVRSAPPDVGGGHPTDATPGIASPHGAHPTDQGAPTGTVVHLPSATAATAGSPSDQLVSDSALDVVEREIVTAMTNGTSFTLSLSPGGVLVLNGATLAFVVLVPATA